MTTRDRDIARAVAMALLAEGPWSENEMRNRAVAAVGRRAFLGPLVNEVVQAYRDAPRDRPRELAAFVEGSSAFTVAARKASMRGRPLARVERWFPVARPELRLVSPALPDLPTVAALAGWLGLTDGELAWYADVRAWSRRNAPDDRLLHYSYRWIPTRSGERLLERPRPVLCGIQRRLLRDIFGRIPLHDAAHGFVPRRSVHTFAAPHAGRRIVVRADLRAFFTGITPGRVWSVLRIAGYPEDVAHALTGLCTTSAPRRAIAAHGTPEQRHALGSPHLPQGAPTSPALANLVAARLDRRLAGLAGARGFRYTRYADDLAFSTDGGGADELLAVVERIVVDEGFAIHPDKVSVQRHGQRQRLAGLVVNERPRMQRREFDALRARLHDAAHHGPEEANHDGVDDFRAHLRGRIAWAAHGEPARARRLLSLYDQIAWPD